MKILCALLPMLALSALGEAPHGLDYRAIHQSADFRGGIMKTGTDIWRLSAAHARQTPKTTVASTAGYDWLTEGSEPWNMVTTFSSVEIAGDAGGYHYPQPGDFYYLYPLHDLPSSPLEKPVNFLASDEDSYRISRGQNLVRITPDPSLPRGEKVFVRYTLDTWSGTPAPLAPVPKKDP